jgi:hypothetical protein
MSIIYTQEIEGLHTTKCKTKRTFHLSKSPLLPQIKLAYNTQYTEDKAQLEIHKEDLEVSEVILDALKCDQSLLLQEGQKTSHKSVSELQTKQNLLSCATGNAVVIQNSCVVLKLRDQTAAVAK